MHSIFLAEGFQLKNQAPLVPVDHLNRAEVKKVDIPVSGKDSVDSMKTDDGTSIKINPYRKVKGMGVHVIYRVTNADKYSRDYQGVHDSKMFLALALQ